MNKQFKLFFFFLAVLIIPALCQASTTVLSNASPNHTVTSGSDEQVYGTSASNQITIESGAKAELINFPGQNSIQIQSSLNLFTVSRSGTVVTFQGADGTVLKIPATTSVQTVDFSDQELLILNIHNGQVMLDDQVITATPVYLGDPELSVNPTSRNVDSEAGTTTFSISNTGVDTMAWTAEVTSGNDWLTIISGESGSDSGTISCQYDANVETDPRTGVIRITATGASGSPMDVTVTQQAHVSCAYSIFPTSGSFSADGESKSISVTPSSSNCTWTTSESLSWVSVSPTSGTGSGSVTVSIDSNTGDARSGSVTIAGETYEISQGEAPCTYEISPTSGSFSSDGGTDTVSVTASRSNCTWTTSESLSWVSVSPTSGTGSGSVTVSIDSNTGDARSGSVTIAGETYEISQEPDPTLCTYSLSSSSNTFASSGGTLTVFVNASNPNCEWTTSESLDWVSLSPTSVTGSGTVTITVDANTNSVRSGSVTLASLTYSINQEEFVPCTYSISPSSSSFNSSGGSITLRVTASKPNCEWTASESLDWITLSPTSGIGSGTVTITATENTGDARSGSISIAGETYDISQDEAYSGDSCGAYVAPDIWKQFECYNLASIGKFTGANPVIPSWELVGGYWQWGRKGPDPDQQDWYNTNTMHFAHGPTGPGESEANSGSINGWSSSDAPDGSWSDSQKTTNDPCPTGYRVPTETQWDGVRYNNTQSTVGTWSSSATNYTSARFFGSELMLPAAGGRSTSSGALHYRGLNGYYWSSSVLVVSSFPLNLLFSSSGYADTTVNFTSLDGFSVRCVAE
jgi:hypothetical protein